MIAQVDPDGLGLRVLLEGLERLVAPGEAGELVAAEGRGDVAFAVAVDADRVPACISRAFRRAFRPLAV